jgi:hypothetical protein
VALDLRLLNILMLVLYFKRHNFGIYFVTGVFDSCVVSGSSCGG